MDFDLGRFPRGQRELRRFVDAVGAVDDSAERYFLELKSDVDLNTKDGRAKVAKFILGALNRMPDAAARRFEGHALMVLGVARDAVTGIPGFEAKDLDQDVKKFAGAAASDRWDYDTVPVSDGRSVVIVHVSPPKWGDKLWACRADGPENLTNGTIFVRADGATRKATGDEIDQLCQRMAVRDTKTGVTVAIEGHAYRVSCDPAVVEEVIEKMRAEIMAASETPTPSSIFLASLSPEQRTYAQFKAEVDRWADEVREVWPVMMDFVAQYRFGNGVRVRHTGGGSLNDIDVTVTFGPSVEAEVKLTEENGREHFPIPDKPLPFGEDHALISSWNIPSLNIGLPPVSASGVVDEVRFENDDEGLRLEITPGDLRQEDDEVWGKDEFVLLAYDSAPSTITGKWRVRGRDHEHVYTGEVTVNVVDVDVTEALRAYFHVGSDEPTVMP